MGKEKAQEVFEAGMRAEEAGHSAKSLRLYAKASALDPTAPHIKLRWASLLYDEGKWRDAIRVAREVIRKSPRIYLAHLVIAQSYAELGRWQVAERFYRKSLAIKPSSISLVLLADILGRLRRMEESEECLRKALRLDPDYEEAHYNLGYIYRMKGKFALAEKHLKRAIKIDRKYGLAYAELGQLLARRKDRTKESASLLKRAIYYDPNDGWSRAYLANALWTLRKLKAAEEQHRKLIELWPDDPLSYWSYGTFLAYESNDRSTAERYLRKATELDPKGESSNYYLGKHLLDWGREAEGKSFLKKAARLGHTQAKERLRSLSR